MLKLRKLVSFVAGCWLLVSVVLTNPAQAQSRITATKATTASVSVISGQQVKQSVSIVVKQSPPVAYNIYRGTVAGVKVKFDTLLVNQTSCIFTEAPDILGNLITGISITYITSDTNVVKILQPNDTTVNMLKLPQNINCP